MGLDKVYLGVRSINKLAASTSAACSPVSGQPTRHFVLGNTTACDDLGAADESIDSRDMSFIDIQGYDATGKLTYFASQVPIVTNTCSAVTKLHVTVPPAP